MLRACALAFVLVGCSLPESGLGADDAGPEPPDATDTGVMTDANVDSEADVHADAVSYIESGEEDSPPAITAGDALQFSGSSYVNVGALPIPGDFTIEAWAFPASTSGETYVVAEDKNGQGAGQFRFGIAAGKLFFLMSDSSGATYGLYSGGYSLITTQTIANSVWTHVAVTKNGAVFALFINGGQAATFTSTSTFTYGGPSVAFRIAARVDNDGSSANGAFNGTIDEVRVWNQPHTASQISATMSTTVPSSSSGLVANWRFDEGSGSVASDQEGTYAGTLVKSPVWVVSTAF